MTKIFGLSLRDSQSIVETSEKEFPPEVQKMLEEREKLRKEKKFVEADKIRDENS